MQKPVVQLIQLGQRIPFDVNQVRTISLDHTDLDSAADCRKQLIALIRSVEDDPTLVDSPISQSIKLKALEQSPDPDKRIDAEILSTLQSIGNRVDQLSFEMMRQRHSNLEPHEAPYRDPTSLMGSIYEMSMALAPDHSVDDLHKIANEYLRRYGTEPVSERLIRPRLLRIVREYLQSSAPLASDLRQVDKS